MPHVYAILRKFSFFSVAFVFILSLGLTACGGDNVKEFQEEGRKLMQEGNANGAIVFFKNALDKDGKNFELRFDLAKAYLKAGKLTQAEVELQKCLLQQPNNPALLLEVAKYNTRKGEHEKALAHLKTFEQASAPTVESHTLSAVNYTVLQKKEEAEEAYKAALGLDPTNIDTRLSLAELYINDKRHIEGLGIVEEILQENPTNISALSIQALHASRTDNFTEAEKIYAKLMTLSPKDISPAYALGSVMMRQGKIKEAEIVLESMNKNFKNTPQTNMLAGIIAYQRQDYKKAATHFQQSVDALPSAEGLYRLAATLNLLQNSESALSNLRRILDASPNHGLARVLTARILLQQKRYEESEFESKKVIELFPNSAEAFHLLGSAQSALGKKEEALESFGKALEISPKMTQASMGRVNILLEQNHDDQAIEELEKGIEAHAEGVAARTALFNYYMGKRDYTKAEEVLQEGLAEIPDHPLLLTLQASLELALRKNDMALATLHKAYAIEPNFLPATQLLLNLYMMQNKTAEALALCDAYLANHPENEAFLVTSALLLDELKRNDEATQRLEKANAMHSNRALVSLVRRALQAKDIVKAEQYLVEKVQAMPSAHTRNMLASFYMEQEQLDKALAIFNTEELKNSLESLVGKFRLYVTAKQYAQALQEAENIIKLQSQSPGGYIFKAIVLEGNKQIDEAFKTLEDAYKKTQAIPLLNNLGELCLRTNNPAKAQSYFTTALLKDPKNKTALTGQGYAYLVQKEYDKAVEAYEKTAELHPNDLITLNNLATALAEQGRNTARAVELATKAYVTEPENEAIIDTYAFTLVANKQISEALNVVQSGLKAHPESGTLYYRLGQALLASSKINEGVTALQKAVELGDFQDIEKAKALLKEHS